jgi:hypothetical protein
MSEGENKTCRKRIKWRENKSQGENKACRRRIKLEDNDRNHISDLQLKIQKIFMLPLDLTIYSLKCKIKEFQKSKEAHINCLYWFF